MNKILNMSNWNVHHLAKNLIVQFMPTHLSHFSSGSIKYKTNLRSCAKYNLNYELLFYAEFFRAVQKIRRTWIFHSFSKLITIFSGYIFIIFPFLSNQTLVTSKPLIRHRNWARKRNGTILMYNWSKRLACAARN